MFAKHVKKEPRETPSRPDTATAREADGKVPAEVPNGITGTAVNENVLTVTLSGQINAENFMEIQDKVMTALDGVGKDGGVIMDCGAVSYVSSAGIRMFWTLSQECQKRSLHYELINLYEHVYNVFHMTGYSAVFNISVKPREFEEKETEQ